MKFSKTLILASPALVAADFYVYLWSESLGIGDPGDGTQTSTVDYSFGVDSDVCGGCTAVKDGDEWSGYSPCSSDCDGDKIVIKKNGDSYDLYNDSTGEKKGTCEGVDQRDSADDCHGVTWSSFTGSELYCTTGFCEE